jgi:tRNA uridine 5-carboxymethylaminomethyl modification enzyme
LIKGFNTMMMVTNHSTITLEDAIHTEKADVLVVGAGHAGIEAAVAAARLGAKTILLTMNLDTIGQMSCNPSIGGPAKSQLVREIDALGGVMGECADATYIQRRMLNTSKGPAVRALRMQSDKALYRDYAKQLIEAEPNLKMRQTTINHLFTNPQTGVVEGVMDALGVAYLAPALVITTGTFLNGRIWIGEKSFGGGRPGDPPAVGLTASLLNLGLTTGRLKTGTPPRLDGRTIDYSGLDIQQGDDTSFFSFLPNRPQLTQIPCHITRTTEVTHQLIRDNIHRSPMMQGLMQADCGPRYCPSIEDKVMRFADKDSHHLFVEPEGRTTYEVYLQGFSSCLPFEVQVKMLHSLPSMEHAEMLKPACAVEYDYFPAYQLTAGMMVKKAPGLFFAGQINGTSGYEEAAAQGLMAGINAARFAGGQEAFVLPRSSSYIGTLIDDLITKEILEPYRMLTSRSEYRLLLRQDNADLRLTPYGRDIGLVQENRWQAYQARVAAIAAEKERLGSVKLPATATVNETLGALTNGEHIREGSTLLQLLRRPKISYEALKVLHPPTATVAPDIADIVETEIKFEGYIERQARENKRAVQSEKLKLPLTADYYAIAQLSLEAREKLSRFQPLDLAQAKRLSGVTPADVQVLQVLLTAGKLPLLQTTV